MSALLMTGFPGFLGSALLPRLLARREGVRAICVVQPQHLATAQRRVREIEAAHPHTLHRIELVEGDITAPGSRDRSGGSRCPRGGERGLAPGGGLRPDGPRGGRPPGQRRGHGAGPRVLPVAPAVQQAAVRQHVLRQRATTTASSPRTISMRGRASSTTTSPRSSRPRCSSARAMADGLPATIYRPGIVVGDSTHRRDPEVRRPVLRRGVHAQAAPRGCAPRGRRLRQGTVRLVPRDYVIDAMDAAVRAGPVGRADLRPHRPEPADRPAGRRCLRQAPGQAGDLGAAAAGSHPGRPRLACPGWSACSACRPRRWTTSPPRPPTPPTNTVADLAGTGLECPPFAELRRPPAGLHGRPSGASTPRRWSERTPAGALAPTQGVTVTSDQARRRRQRQPRPDPTGTTTST